MLGSWLPPSHPPPRFLLNPGGGQRFLGKGEPGAASLGPHLLFAPAPACGSRRRGPGSRGPASETRSLGCTGHLPWHHGRARGKRGGVGGQCRMAVLWRQWASVAPGEEVVPGQCLALVSGDESPIRRETMAERPSSPQALCRWASLRAVRVHRLSPLHPFSL